MSKKTIIYLTGEQGTGKTRLANEFKNALEVPVKEYEQKISNNPYWVKSFFNSYDYLIITSCENNLFFGLNMIRFCKENDYHYIKCQTFI